MIENLLIFAFSLFLVTKGATFATRYAARLAESFRLSKYTIGFIVVAVISILPEMFIALNAAGEGVPEFGLSVLFGSNVADLTLLFAAVIFLAGRGIKIESKILKNNTGYPFLLLLPLVLGLDGYLSRLEGAALVITGAVFYYIAFKNGHTALTPARRDTGGRLKNLLLLLCGMATLLLGAHFTVTSATDLASILKVSPILIGMLVVGLGTTLPEFFFALKSAKKNNDDLAVGDILGTVLADATVVVGLLALASPFAFPTKIIYVTGVFMVGAAVALFRFMRSGRALTKKEGYMLFVFWLMFVLVEFMVNR